MTLLLRILLNHLANHHRTPVSELTNQGRPKQAALLKDSKRPESFGEHLPSMFI